MDESKRSAIKFLEKEIKTYLLSLSSENPTSKHLAHADGGWGGARWAVRVAAILLATLLCSGGSIAYSALTHEEIVDLV
jgi:hypothetical protein